MSMLNSLLETIDDTRFTHTQTISSGFQLSWDRLGKVGIVFLQRKNIHRNIRDSYLFQHVNQATRTRTAQTRFNNVK